MLGRDGSGFSAGMLRLVRTELAKEPELADYRLTETDTIRVDAVRGVTLNTPRYQSPSRLMTKMEMTLDVSAVPKAAKAVASNESPELISAVTYTVTLDLFPEAVLVLGLSVYV